MMVSDDYVQNDEGLYVPSRGVSHRSDEYDEEFLPVLAGMQDQHFWYRGRHRFLLHAVRENLRRTGKAPDACRAIDLGGAAGGGWPTCSTCWSMCRTTTSTCSSRCGPAWCPGGLLFVTVPALKFFWSDNDRMVGHLRRYARHELAHRARESGFRVLDARYFMFFLSPMLLVQRLWSDALSALGRREEDQAIVRRTHRVPPRVVNTLLSLVFESEVPLGFHLPFPWGTSLLMVLQKLD